MTLFLRLPPAVLQRLEENAAKSGQSVEEYVQDFIVREAVGSTIAYPAGFSSPEDRSKAIREWAENHPTIEHFVDDSRDGIYAGQGE